jgi:hypothetical protein
MKNGLKELFRKFYLDERDRIPHQVGKFKSKAFVDLTDYLHTHYAHFTFEWPGDWVVTVGDNNDGWSYSIRKVWDKS